MRILLTNDDGILAPGIQALWQELSKIGDVAVVAPDSERSATSQAITVHQPIRVDEHFFEEERVTGWRIGGTPTDCVKIGVEALLQEKPDIIVSGINQGANLGTDVLYSGTVSAAIEGALLGYPAIAVSLTSWQYDDFSVAAEFTSKLVQITLEKKLPPNTLLNVNVPPLKANEFAGVEITRLGVIQYENIFEHRQDPRGRSYYWMGGRPVHAGNGKGSDVVAVEQRKISVTPIHFDLTNYNIMPLIKEWNLST
ncbi:MAG: surE [Firmicutes bacterium]|nr:surE [Bacillota bacterium]